MRSGPGGPTVNCRTASASATERVRWSRRSAAAMMPVVSRTSLLLLLPLIGCGSVKGAAPDAGGLPGDAVPADASRSGDGLVAWYKLDSLVQTTTPDATGNADAVCARATCPAATPNGRIDGAFLFNGVDQLLHVASTPSLKTTRAFTVSVWLNRAAGATNACIVNKSFGTNGNNSWQACVSAAGKLAFFSSSTASNDALPSDPVIATGGWHHVALWWNGTTKATYIDGQRTAHNDAMISFDDSDITIGADTDGSTTVAPLNGELDDVRIYDPALSDAEIIALAAP
jgi:hypothetical protein